MTVNTQILDFKSVSLCVVRIVLYTDDLDYLTTVLKRRIDHAGDLFKNEPIVIDVTEVRKLLDWKRLLRIFQKHQLLPMGVMASEPNLKASKKLGLVPMVIPSTTLSRLNNLSIDYLYPATFTQQIQTLPLSKTIQSVVRTRVHREEKEITTKDGVQTTSAIKNTASHGTFTSTQVITRHLRSGQQVYARNSDLVIVGAVSQHAEIIADGNVHVYGPLRGKAIAGANGNTTAHIFTTQFDAELIAIAGIYQVVEKKPEKLLHNQAVMVSLKNKVLRVEAI